MKDYILIKLRSGEEIIASIMSKNRNGLKIFRPMQIRQVPFMDHISGLLKSAIVLDNWIGRTNENHVTVPNNWVGVKMIPSQEVIDAYEKCMIKQDTPEKKNASQLKQPIPEEVQQKEDDLKRVEEEMNKMFLDMMSEKGSSFSQVDEVDSFISAMKDGKETGREKEVVVINFMIPSKLFRNMMEDGVLDELMGMGMVDDADDEDLEDDVDSGITKKESHENLSSTDLGETGKEDWGNSFKDWSPDPKDYL
jgi:hypothetical protein